jgi:hypothetical protein
VAKMRIMPEAADVQGGRVRHSLARLRWRARRMVGLLGLPAMAGLACLVVAAGVGVHALVTEHDNHGLSQRAQRSQARVATPPARGEQDDLTATVAAFYAKLPMQEMMGEQMQMLNDIALRSGVALLQADYSVQADRDAPLARYTMTIPIRGDALKVQSFVLLALQDMPTLALESIALKRERIEATEVEATIAFVLLVRQPAGKKGGA